VKYIEDVEGESALWSCDGRWEAAEPEELNMTRSASRRIVASTELNVDSVDTRQINDYEVFLNGTGTGTRWGRLNMQNFLNAVMEGTISFHLKISKCSGKV
jgi:hypothetical protein